MVTGHRSQVGSVDHKRSFKFWSSPKLLPNMGMQCQRAWNQTLKFLFPNGFHRGKMLRSCNFGSWFLGMESLLTTLTWLFQMFFMIAKFNFSSRNPFNLLTTDGWRDISASRSLPKILMTSKFWWFSWSWWKYKILRDCVIRDTAGGLKIVWSICLN